LKTCEHRSVCAGANLEFDLAVQARPRIVQFLQQDSASPLKLEQSVKQLGEFPRGSTIGKGTAAQAMKARPRSQWRRSKFEQRWQ